MIVEDGPGKRRDDRGTATRALLRADPPAEAMEWVLTVTGAKAVTSAESMPGGSSVAMHRINLVSAVGHSQELILRRYLRAEQLADDPGVAAHEAMVLELIADMATPTPRLVGCDPTGEGAGSPAGLDGRANTRHRTRSNGDVKHGRRVPQIAPRGTGPRCYLSPRVSTEVRGIVVARASRVNRPSGLGPQRDRDGIDPR